MLAETAQKRTSTIRMVGESFTEMLSRRGLINNLVTAGFIGLGLFTLFSNPKSASGTDSSKLADPIDAKVTSKVFFDITIGGKPAGRIVMGMFGDGKALSRIAKSLIFFRRV